MASMWSAAKRLTGMPHKNVLKQTVLDIAHGLSEKNPKKLTSKDMLDTITATKGAAANAEKMFPGNTDARRTKVYLTILTCFERYLIDINTLETPTAVVKYMEENKKCMLESLVALTGSVSNFADKEAMKEIYTAVQDAGLNQSKVFNARKRYLFRSYGNSS